MWGILHLFDFGLGLVQGCLDKAEGVSAAATPNNRRIVHLAWAVIPCLAQFGLLACLLVHCGLKHGWALEAGFIDLLRHVVSID